MLSGVAKKYAVSDNYHASSPTQTWPNRAFMHAGTSEGKVNNFPYLPYTSKTIFNVFEENQQSWAVYKSSEIIPSLTRLQMAQLWDPLLDDHFHHVDKFIDDCHSGSLPAYSFILSPVLLLRKGRVRLVSILPRMSVREIIFYKKYVMPLSVVRRLIKFCLLLILMNMGAVLITSHLTHL